MENSFKDYTKYELQELWRLPFIEACNKPTASEGEKDAVFCFEIDNAYRELFGLAEFNSWKEKR